MNKLNMTLGYTTEEYSKFKKYSWLFLASFSLLCVCANCCRLNFSAAIPLMCEEGWTTGQLGIATGAFFWVYALGQMINGRVSDALRAKKLITGAAILTGAINIVIGFQSSLPVICALWIINGAFQSAIWSPGVGALSKWWPAANRGFATGFAHAFNGLGQGVCVLVVSAALVFMPQSGWHAAFWIPALLPMAGAVVFFLLAKQSPKDIGLTDYEEKSEETRKKEQELLKIKKERGMFYPYAYMLKKPAFIIWVCMAFLIGIARYGMLTWVPYYFVDRFEVEITDGLVSTFVIPLGMAIGTLVVPWITDKVCPGNRMPAVIVSALLAAMVTGCFFMIRPGIMTSVLLFFAGFFIYAINGLAWTFASDIGGRVFAGTVSGALNFASYLGAGCQAALFGCILESRGWGYVFLTISAGLLIISGLSILGSRLNIKGSKAV